MTYRMENTIANSFTGMELLVRKTVVVGYTMSTILAASATLPKTTQPAAFSVPSSYSCSVHSHSDLSNFLLKHAEVSFGDIWNDPEENIWDTM